MKGVGGERDMLEPGMPVHPARESISDEGLQFADSQRGDPQRLGEDASCCPPPGVHHLQQAGQGGREPS